MNFTFELDTEGKFYISDVSIHQPRTTLPPAVSVTDTQPVLDMKTVPNTILPVVTTPDTPWHSPTEQSLKFQTEVYTKPTDTGV